MYTFAYTIPVNPPGTAIPLTRDLVWRGLVMKAENALPFVPVMQACDVVERFDGGLVRHIRIGGETLIERVILTPEIQVLFERLDDAGTRTGWIANVLSEDETGLLLTFVINVEGDANAGEAMKGQYIGAIATTLKKTRELASAGTLP
jgi:hypothetical protein